MEKRNQLKRVLVSNSIAGWIRPLSICGSVVFSDIAAIFIRRKDFSQIYKQKYKGKEDAGGLRRWKL